MSKTDKGLEVTIVTKDPEKNDEKISTIEEVECLLWAIGRQPNTSGLNIGSMVTIYTCSAGHIYRQFW